MAGKQTLGREAEHRAERWLARQGLQPISRNYRCRGGEIDLIMADGQSLVFVEVRYRKSDSHGGALASIDSHKQRRLMLAAQHYLQTSGWQGPCRFDVVGFETNNKEPQWIRNAFDS